ncbi:MAG: hypothetical protein OXK76_14050 [Gammaproteobacteria bacterium]|nr:hypothetical protein [Gammaproteobacteria bacterium]
MSMRPTTPEQVVLQELREYGYDATLDPSWFKPPIKALVARYINVIYWSNPDHWIAVRHVPYVRYQRKRSPEVVTNGTLVIAVDTEDGRVTRPFHWSLWRGHYPHTKDGRPLSHLEIPDGGLNRDVRQSLASRQIIGLSQKPKPDGKYPSHLAKVRKYVSFITPHAQEKEASVSATSPNAR